MKINFEKLQSLARKTRLLLLPTVAALAVFAASNSQAAQKFPDPTANDWDCVTTGGGQDGVLFLHFTDDFDPISGFPTFEGFFADAGARRIKGNVRGGVNTGRTPNTNSTTFTNLFGGGSIQGSAGEVEDNGGPNDWFADSRGERGIWGYNSKGQLVGFFFTVENVSGLATNFGGNCTNITLAIALTNDTIFITNFDICITNGPTVSTNITLGPFPDGEGSVVSNIAIVNTNFFISPKGVTNDVSFTGTIEPGKRMNLVASSSIANFTIRGVPLQEITAPVTDFFWSAQKIQNGVVFQELFKMFPDPVIPNLFDLVGQGPSYNYTNSFCLISSQKKIAFAITESEVGSTNATFLQTIRASVGSFTSSKNSISAKTTGFTTLTAVPIRFNASAVPLP